MIAFRLTESNAFSMSMKARERRILNSFVFLSVGLVSADDPWCFGQT